MSALSKLLLELVRDSGLSKKAFGEAVGLRGASLSHVLSGDKHYSLGVEACLRVADVCKVPPSVVLRAAGKETVATLIERLYGPAAERLHQFAGGAKITVQEETHLSMYRAMSDDVRAQRAVDLLMAHVVRDHVRPRPPRLANSLRRKA